jgi:ornithine decarboxylase
MEPLLLAKLPYKTPFLYMSTRVVGNQLQAFDQAMPGVAVHYAMKCNPDPTLLHYLHTHGTQFEIASYPELQELQKIGVEPHDVIFSNPVKIEAHIAAAAKAGLYRFAFDSPAELQKIARQAPGASVYVRLATTNAGSAVASEGKFGIDIATSRLLMLEAKKLGLVPYGIAFHVGSQMSDPAAWAHAIAQSGELMRRLWADGIRVTMLDVGGGFPAHYEPHVPTLATYGRVIRRALAALPYKPELLVIEPGRGLVGDAGVMVSTVIGLATRHGKRWLHLDVGAFNGFMESLETNNTLRFPVADSRGSKTKTSFNITGPSCDSQDTIMYGCQLSKELAIGDRVFTYTAGAYTTSYASRFNGFDIPAVYYAEI